MIGRTDTPESLLKEIEAKPLPAGWYRDCCVCRRVEIGGQWRLFSVPPGACVTSGFCPDCWVSWCESMGIDPEDDS